MASSHGARAAAPHSARPDVGPPPRRAAIEARPLRQYCYAHECERERGRSSLLHRRDDDTRCVRAARGVSAAARLHRRRGDVGRLVLRDPRVGALVREPVPPRRSRQRVWQARPRGSARRMRLDRAFEMERPSLRRSAWRCAVGSALRSTRGTPRERSTSTSSPTTGGALKAPRRPSTRTRSSRRASRRSNVGSAGQIHVEMNHWEAGRLCGVQRNPLDLLGGEHRARGRLAALRRARSALRELSQPASRGLGDADPVRAGLRRRGSSRAYNWECPPRASAVAGDRALQTGDYVRLVGTLWEDGNHGHGDCWTMSNSRTSQRGWLEMHPVDFIARIPERTDASGRAVTGSGITVGGACVGGNIASQAGTVDFVAAPSSPRPGPSWVLRYQEILNPDFTNQRSLARDQRHRRRRGRRSRTTPFTSARRCGAARCGAVAGCTGCCGGSGGSPRRVTAARPGRDGVLRRALLSPRLRRWLRRSTSRVSGARPLRQPPVLHPQVRRSLRRSRRWVRRADATAPALQTNVPTSTLHRPRGVPLR